MFITKGANYNKINNDKMSKKIKLILIFSKFIMIDSRLLMKWLGLLWVLCLVYDWKVWGIIRLLLLLLNVVFIVLIVIYVLILVSVSFAHGKVWYLAIG